MILREYQARQRGESAGKRSQRRILQRWIQQGRRFDLRIYQSVMERSDDAIATAKTHWSVRQGAQSIGWRRHPPRRLTRNDMDRDVRREEARTFEEARGRERPPPEPPPVPESLTATGRRRRRDDQDKTDQPSTKRRRRTGQMAQTTARPNGMQRSGKRKRGTPDLEPEDPFSQITHYFPNKKNST